MKGFLTSTTLYIQYGPITNNACYSNIDAPKLYINVKGTWPVVDST